MGNNAEVAEAPSRTPNAVEKLDHYLEVGDPIFLDLNSGVGKMERYRTVLRGWETGTFLMIEKPVPKGYLSLRAGQHCAVRFIKDGQIWGFMSYIMDAGPKAEGRILAIKWPWRATCVQARRYERVAVRIPCVIDLADGSRLKDTMCDLSVGGCRIHSKVQVTERTKLLVSFQLPDSAHVENLAAVVRGPSEDERSNGVAYGCEFLDKEESEGYGIGLFVVRTLAQTRGEPIAHPVFLVLSEILGDACDLRGAIGDASRCEVLSATGFVDAAYRLRSTPPKALFVRADHKELPGDTICTVVKHTEGLESIPILFHQCCAQWLRHASKGVFAR